MFRWIKDIVDKNIKDIKDIINIIDIMPLIKKQYVVNGHECTAVFNHPVTGDIEIPLALVSCIPAHSKEMARIAGTKATICNDFIYLYEVFVNQKRYGAIIAYKPLTLVGYGSYKDEQHQC